MNTAPIVRQLNKASHKSSRWRSKYDEINDCRAIEYKPERQARWCFYCWDSPRDLERLKEELKRWGGG